MCRVAVIFASDCLVSNAYQALGRMTCLLIVSYFEVFIYLLKMSYLLLIVFRIYLKNKMCASSPEGIFVVYVVLFVQRRALEFVKKNKIEASSRLKKDHK